MSVERKVAVITGASQGIGAGLVRGFLDRGYCVVANSRSIRPDTSADMLAIAGDIADSDVADRVSCEAASVSRFLSGMTEAIRTGRLVGQVLLRRSGQEDGDEQGERNGVHCCQVRWLVRVSHPHVVSC